MKKVMILLMAMTMVCCLMGCQPGSTTNNTSTVGTTTSTEASVAIGDVATTNTVAMTTSTTTTQQAPATTKKPTTATTTVLTTATTTKSTTTNTKLATTTTMVSTTTTTTSDPDGTVRVFSDDNLFSIAVPEKMATVMQKSDYYEGISIKELGLSGEGLGGTPIYDICLYSGDGYCDRDGLVTTAQFFAVPNEFTDKVKSFWEEPTQYMTGDGDTIEGSQDSLYELRKIAANDRYTIYCYFQDLLGWDPGCKYKQSCKQEPEYIDDGHILLHLIWDNMDMMCNSVRWESGK